MEGIGGLGLTGSSIGEAVGKRPAPSSSNTKAANTAATRAHGDSTAGTTESETPEVNAPYLHNYNNIMQGLIQAPAVIIDGSLGGEIRHVHFSTILYEIFIIGLSSIVNPRPKGQILIL